MGVEDCSCCSCGVVGSVWRSLQALRTRDLRELSSLESEAVEGESPVGEAWISVWDIFLSRLGHEKSRLKLAGPSAKAKYDPVTDSGPVP